MRFSRPSAAKPTPPGVLVAALAARQDGVVSLAQLVEVGVNPPQARAWAQTGRLHRLHRGVYAVGHRAVTEQAGRRAALLALGPAAALSHRTAAVHLGLTPYPPRLMHVSLAGSRRASRPGIQVHHPRSLTASDISVVAGLRCTTATRTLVDLAQAKDFHLQQLCNQAEFLGLLDPPAIAATLARLGHPPGTTALREALQATSLGSALADSKLESRVFAALVDAGLPAPVQQQRFDLRPEYGRIRVDLWWPDRRLVVEVDGPHHLRPLQLERDHRRDAALARREVRVCRVPAAEFDADPVAVVRRVAALLAV